MSGRETRAPKDESCLQDHGLGKSIVCFRSKRFLDPLRTAQVLVVMLGLFREFEVVDIMLGPS